MKKIIFALLVVSLAAPLAAEHPYYPFQSGKGKCSVKISMTMDEETAALLQDGSRVNLQTFGLLGASVKNKGKLFAYKGDNLSINFKPKNLKFKYKSKKLSTSESGTDVMVFRDTESASQPVENFSASAAGPLQEMPVLEEDSPFVYLWIPATHVTTMTTSVTLGTKGKNLVFKGPVDNAMFNVKYTPAKKSLKFKIKGVDFLIPAIAIPN